MPYRKNKSNSCKQNYGKRVRPFSSDIEDLIIEEVQYGPETAQMHQEKRLQQDEIRNIACQTEESLINARYTGIHQKFNFENIRDLICILIDLIPNYGAIQGLIMGINFV
jgi:hypothetical protein